MKKKPILSIIIPVYNVESYVKSCIESILKNDLKDDVEVIIVDDGSKDNSISMVNSLVKDNKHFKIYKKVNGGLSSARNYGLEHAHGEWIWFIDSDDCISKYSISYLIKNIAIHKSADIFIFRYNMFTLDSEIKCKKPSFSIKNLTLLQGMQTLFDLQYASFAWNKIFKAELFKKIRFPNGRVYEDMSIMYKVFAKSKNIILLSDILYYYRQRKSSIVHSDSVSNLRDAAIAHYEMYMFMKENFPELNNQLKYETLVRIISYFHRLKLKDIKKNDKLYTYLLNYDQYPSLNKRYKIEVLSLKYCYPIFKIIGYVGILNRKLKDEK